MTREQAIEKIKNIEAYLTAGNPIWDTDSINEACQMAVTALDKRETGHWIMKEGKEQGYDIGGAKTWYIQIMCSECRFIKTAIEGHTGQYHYCPNCGAKMEEQK